MSAAPRPLPAKERDSLPWWEALARHEMVLQRCRGCELWRWPPREICNRCGSMDWGWEPISGRGAVVSWIVNHHSFSEACESPYVVLAVRLAEQDDIVMYGSWTGPGDGAGLRVDLPVTASFDDVTSGDDPVTLLQWSPADAGRAAGAGPGPAAGAP